MGGLFVFLGTGASTGVPVIGCQCARCQSISSYNRRLRSAGWLQVSGRSLLIDVGPDFRQQALMYKIGRIDGLLLTHTHFDHIAGIDDLRIYSVRQANPIPCLLSQESFHELQVRYCYLFKTGKSSTAKFHCQPLPTERGTVLFEEIEIGFCHYMQGDMKVTGYRIGDFAYISDIHDYSSSIFDSLQGVNHLVLSALRAEPSHVHLSLDQAVDFARKVGARQTRLTHLSHFLDYEEVNRGLPADVQLGYDGLTIEFEV
ncbi:MAG: MBL fold metallo-hydrolase [Chlamydiales bacterium]|nr:MBL fold metallo-hydrolase [Chlamydiales bacterium]